MQTKTDTFVNSEDRDETARCEPSHQDLHCLPFWYWYLTENAICNNGSCRSSLFVRRRFFLTFVLSQFLISSSFGASGGLCFVVVAFP